MPAPTPNPRPATPRPAVRRRLAGLALVGVLLGTAAPSPARAPHQPPPEAKKPTGLKRPTR